MASSVNIYRVEIYHIPGPGMSSPFWKVMRDILQKQKAIRYADECARYYKATARVTHIFNKEMKAVYSSSPESPSMQYFDTLEGRAKDLMFVEYLENCEHQYEDIPFMRVFEFQNTLDTADGKVALYDLTVKLRKELH